MDLSKDPRGTGSLARSTTEKTTGHNALPCLAKTADLVYNPPFLQIIFSIGIHPGFRVDPTGGAGEESGMGFRGFLTFP